MTTDSSLPVRILHIEDSETDAELILRCLKQSGLNCVCTRVETEVELRGALQSFGPTIILSDYDLPRFDGDAALSIARELAPHVPFIYVSGKMGEERAVNALDRGAIDYVLKSNLARLAAAVTRAVSEAASRRRHEAHIAQLNRVLRMLCGVSSAMVRIHDRAELLRETCRIAVSVGRYTAVVAAAKLGGSQEIQPVAWAGVDDASTEVLRGLCAASAADADSLIGRVTRSGESIICNDARSPQATESFHRQLAQAGLLSMAALPILVDKKAVEVLVLAARDAEMFADEELRVLHEVAGDLSFAWQYLRKDTAVRFLSHFDSQTGLAKRSRFCERLSRLLAEPAAGGTRYAVTVLDIERLGLINDSLGRRTGDLLLQQIAARMKRRFPKTENLAHLGGGTFATIEDCGMRSVHQVAAIIQANVAEIAGEPFSIEQHRVPVAIRCGSALHPQDGRDAETLVQRAEAALLYARASGLRQLHFSASRHSEQVGTLAMEHKIRLALERAEFELHYQPKVNVITRRIEGVEALIRWRDPNGAMISPAAFLPVVESAGLGNEVGAWVIQQAARDCQQWRQAGLPPVRIAVNLSPAQLQRADFTTTFLEAISAWSSSVWGLDIEVRESALHEDSAAEVQKLKQLRKNGVKIAIDDFGTGYSSLGRLASLPIDALKIDGRFIGQVPADPGGKTVVKTIVALAHGLNMTTIAEGVEKQEQLDFLWQIGCDQSQGYLHSKPIPRDEFALLLQHGSGQLVLPAEPAAEEPRSAAAWAGRDAALR